ncbi:MAG: glycerophosphodiester phosphodiesterase family protein [Chitinophagaceae bacterium]
MKLPVLKTVFGCLFFLSAQSQHPLNVLPVAKHKTIIVAHRGDHVTVPENTIASFEQAIAHDIDYVEADLRTTKDSVLVMMHDATVDRTTNGKGKVSELNYADLRALRTWDNKGVLTTHHILSFEEMLQCCKNRICIYLDFKDASVLQAWQLIRKYGMEQQVIVYINAPEQLTAWRTVAPQIPLMISLPDSVRTPLQVKQLLQRIPVEILDGDYTDYTPGMVKAAEEMGVQVWPDIQGEHEDQNWENAIATGFHGLQTDHPAALSNFLKKKLKR